MLSLVVHGALLLAAGAASRHQAARPKSTPIRIREVAPPPPPPPAAEAPPPTEVAPVVAEAPRTRPKPKRTPEPTTPSPAPAKSAAKAPLDLGLFTGGDSGPGLAVGAPAKPPTAATPVAAEEPKPPERQKAKKRLCNEASSKPVPVEKVQFDYPHDVREAGVEGRLIMRLHVSAAGKVTNVEILRSVDPRLDKVASSTARKWRFTPAMACGRRVASTYTLARRFELGA